MLALSLSLTACGDDETEGEGEETPTEEPSEPEAPPLPEVGSLFAGEDHTCAVNDEGQAFCWGRNLDGELGDGTGQNRRVPVPVRGLTGVHSLALGRYHSCALRNDGTVACWGRNDNGQLGDGTTDSHAEPTDVEGLEDVVQIAAGNEFTCAVKRDGTVACWGDGTDGRLGTGSDDDVSEPTAVAGLSDVVEVALGARHACARHEDGTMHCWGSNLNKQLGTGDDENRQMTPVQVPDLADAIQISSGGDNTCVVHEGGTLSCWGDTYYGKVGNGESGTGVEDVATPFAIASLEGVEEVGVGVYQVCARLAEAVHCWGHDGYGNLGAEERGDSAEPQAAQGLTDAAHLAVGGYHVCAEREGGAASCWGKANEGQLGADEIEDQYHPGDRIASLGSLSAEAPTLATFAPDPAATATSSAMVSTGQGYACGVRDDGHVLCWGTNHSGQLGDGTAINRMSTAVEVLGITDAVEVRSHQSETCARRANGTIACWGSVNRINGSTEFIRSSRPIGLEGVEDAIGFTVTSSGVCALREGGTVTCSSNGTVAAVAGLEGVAQLAGAGGTTCARLESGTVMCWGSGSYGQLGNGEASYASEPVEVAGINDAVDLDMLHYHGCVARRNGSVSCWGSNDHGQVGNGRSGEDQKELRPVAVRGLRSVVDVATGYDNTCARREDGSIVCWGRNSSNQCATGEERDARTDPVLRPTEIATGAEDAFTAMGPPTQLSCGWSYCCTLHREGRLACWGSSSAMGEGSFGGLMLHTSNIPRAMSQAVLSTGAAPIPVPAATVEPAAEEPPAEEPPAEEPPAEEPPAEEPSARPPAQSPRTLVEAAVRRAARQCYTRYSLRGQVVVRIVVGADGRVSRSQVLQNGTGNQETGRCISGALVGQRFSRPRAGEATFDIPFSG